MARFIVAGIQRTGTNLVRTLLNSHPDILCLGEAFDRKNKEDLGYPRYCASSLNKRIRQYVFKRKQIYQYLEQLYEQPYSAIGLKFMFSQARRTKTVIEYTYAHRIRVIQVRRQNLLRTFISRKLAKTRKIYHSKQDVPVIRISLNVDSLIRNLDRISREAQGWRKIIKELECHEVIYENLSTEFMSECQKMLFFLNVNESTALSTQFRKVTPNRMEEFIDNYYDIVKILKGTKYNQYLD